MFLFPFLVIIDQFHILDIVAVHPENDSPIGLDSDGPESFSVSLERVQMIVWNSHRFYRLCYIQLSEDDLDSIHQISPDQATVTKFIESFQPSMAKTEDHSNYRKLSIGSCQLKLENG